MTIILQETDIFDKYVFTERTPGTLEIVLKAKARPKKYEKDIIWEIPDIGNFQKTIYPASAKGSKVTVRYKGLPKQNSDFGEKTFKASIDKGNCIATDTTKISVFFPRDTKNNPRGKEPYDDEELATWFEEAKWKIGNADKEDWAKPGKQWPR